MNESSCTVTGQSTRKWSRRDASHIDGQTDRSNGAYGKSDIEGKAAREAVSELGKERVSNEWEPMSQKLRSWVHQWLDADLVIIRAARVACHFA